MIRYLLLAALGVAELLVPERIVALSTRLAYDSTEEIRVKPWVTTAVRIEGLVFLAVALRKLLGPGRPGDDGGDGRDWSGGSDDAGGSKARQRALAKR